MFLQKTVQALWHSDNAFSRLLSPLSWLYAREVRRRRQRFLEAPPPRWPVPVIVVGNITVGGTGKTPMVIWLVEWLRMQGWRPGVVSRGYGGHASGGCPHTVLANDDPAQVGDEPLLIAHRSGVPVVVCRDRAAAVHLLLDTSDCNIIISDDGLQHYRLSRDIEIAMIDGKRRLGNARCLPAGPLREPVDRLREVDFVVVTEGNPESGEYGLTLALSATARRVGPTRDDDMRDLREFEGEAVHAVAGIGNPERFFMALERAGLRVIRHPLPDHHPIAPADIDFGDTRAVLMTEKDAVKCRSFASPQVWTVSADAVPEQTWIDAFSERLRRVCDGQETA